MKIENNLEIVVKLNEVILSLVANTITKEDIIKLQNALKDTEELYKEQICK